MATVLDEPTWTGTIDTAPLRRKAKVKAAVAMPGIPEGTRGKVTFVAGFDWVRYWVRFENGVARGSIDRSKLVLPDEPVGAELAAVLARAEQAPVAAAGAGDDVGGDVAGDGAGDVVHAGVTIPAHLLERAKRRRELLSA